MRFVLAALIIAFVFSSCGEDVDGDRWDMVVYKQLLQELVFRNGKPAFSRSVPVFIAIKRDGKWIDPDDEIVAQLSKTWPVMGVSNALPLLPPLRNEIIDVKTLRRGWMIWIEKIEEVDANAVRVRCGLFYNSTSAVHYEMRLARFGKEWKVANVVLKGES